MTHSINNPTTERLQSVHVLHGQTCASDINLLDSLNGARADDAILALQATFARVPKDARNVRLELGEEWVGRDDDRTCYPRLFVVFERHTAT